MEGVNKEIAQKRLDILNYNIANLYNIGMFLKANVLSEKIELVRKHSIVRQILGQQSYGIMYQCRYKKYAINACISCVFTNQMHDISFTPNN